MGKILCMKRYLFAKVIVVSDYSEPFILKVYATKLLISLRQSDLRYNELSETACSTKNDYSGC